MGKVVSSKDLDIFFKDLFSSYQSIPDVAPNGIQVEGKPYIRHLVTGVTASKLFLEKAIQLGADAVLVHHGLFWKGQPYCVTGPLYARLQSIFANGLTLFAYHLPLDLHHSFGNNTQFGKILGLKEQARGKLLGVEDLGVWGSLPEPLAVEAFSTHLGDCLQRPPLHIFGKAPFIQRVAWCTGAAQEGIAWAASLEVDAYLSGEISEQTTHAAREYGVHYFACGHHASERYGVKALGDLVQKTFEIQVSFCDIENPV